MTAVKIALAALSLSIGIGAAAAGFDPARLTGRLMVRRAGTFVSHQLLISFDRLEHDVALLSRDPEMQARIESLGRACDISLVTNVTVEGRLDFDVFGNLYVDVSSLSSP